MSTTTILATSTKLPSSSIQVKTNAMSPAATPAPQSPTASAPATLRSLYPRAARAFLHREVALTHSLLDSAFNILTPPAAPKPDALSSQRKKWDILRITFDTTLYTSPSSRDDVPPALQQRRALSPASLAADLHAQSLRLFTPVHYTPNIMFLPPQVLVTLVLSSIKLESFFVSRGLIEDWLARREPESDAETYEKVLEMYCLHVLPALEEWEYATEFLGYETELSPEKRQFLISSLGTLHARLLAARRPPSPSRTPTPKPVSYAPNGRTPSPSPSTSSVSTASTHTIVPGTPRPTRPFSQPMTPLTSTSTTPRQQSPTPPSSSSHSRSQLTHTAFPRSPAPAQPLSTTPLSTIAVIKAMLRPYITAPNFTFVLIAVLLPLFSLLLRLRRRHNSTRSVSRPPNISSGPPSSSASNIADVRKRLQTVKNRNNLVGRIWNEAIRAVTDTISMAGNGLV